MKDFLEYVLDEVKNKRLLKTDAIELIRQFKISSELKSKNDQGIKKEEAFGMMTFKEVWQEKTVVHNSLTQIKTVVCFLSNPENQQGIVDVMQGVDQEVKVIFISQSTSYQKKSQDEYGISPREQKTYEQAFQSIREDYGQVDAVLYLWPIEDSTCIQDYSIIIYILKSLASLKLKAKRVLLGAQFENGLEQCYLDSWIGFERSLGLVLPNTQVAVIYQDISEGNSAVTIKDWGEKLWSELQMGKKQSALYKEGKRYVCQIEPTTIQTGGSMLKAGGTYLITGGCGGLGLLFAKYFANKQSVNLILVGRSPMDAKKEAEIKALEELGSEVFYMQADVCNLTEMQEGLARAKARFGEIHGVIHAAGLADNQNIFEKSIQSFEKILEPKIKGTIVLDEVLQGEALHFICYFSSSAGILGDFGSCDYAIANRFQMAYAHYRNKEEGVQRGKIIVINWPLWKDGSMGVGEKENSKMYLKSSGQRFLETQEGLKIFDKLLFQENTQHLVMVGERSRVYRFLGLVEEELSMVTPIISKSSGKGRRMEMKGLSVEQCLEWDLKEYISQLLEIERNKLDREDNLADFGFDSVSLAQFANLLTNHYELEITPALFFGYSTIEKLTQYFLMEYQDNMQKFYKEMMAVQEVPQEVSVAALRSQPPELVENIIAIENNTPQMEEPIAIIGMSGRFPKARTIDEMWKILANGEDVVQDFWEDRFSNKGKSKYKYGCIPGVSEFDPLFFEISPREAENMDPRQRLLLQESWKALEDAGYGESQIKTNKMGMFVGVEEGDYRLLSKEKSSITSNHNAILSARLAYFLNLSGPNMAINTACSSGLVAVHQACLSIRNHECDTALAAGVNLMFTTSMFEGMSEAGMLSEDGKCFVFDKRANGMVPGEAVAVVVLKRLSQAKADGDPIYAVIKGSGINYDGKTNGITAPSGVAQTKLLKSVYDQYKINLEEIEYIVTHGTGTKLGDPIEINALYDVFTEYTKKQGYCALTSTKTNFGHALAASGVVSLISLVQSFRHETIPASLHCEHENEYIHWSGSPFYVNKTSRNWPACSGKNRMGAVSAFGMGGTNVHMVLESYHPEKRGKNEKIYPYYILAFSAKTQEALQEKFKDIIASLENKSGQEGLLQVSYTLLEGRQHFNHRCAIVVQDRDDAIYVLQQVGKKEKTPNLFQGIVNRDFTGQKALKEYGKDLLKQSCSLLENKNKYQEILYALADLYCQGYELPWNLLYGAATPDRIHLPTYPFAREHYWVVESKSQVINNTGQTVIDAFLHPLLHKNTSNFSEQGFSSTFTGQEFFLKDHVVKGQRVLPGVAYLEMARGAVEQATGLLEDDDTVIKLKNVVWSRPVTIGDHPIQVHIGLFPEENGEITYEIYSHPADCADAIVHSQGSASLVGSITEVETLDINRLQAECNQSVLSSAQCYEAFAKMGITYGPGHRGIVTVYVGLDKVFSKLTLPSCILDTQEQFVLHPSVMDSALQASIGLMMCSGNHKPSLPFALQELEIIKKCTSVMWALIRYSDGSKAGDKVQKLDIDLCDEQGLICVRMKGFSSRILEGEIGAVGAVATIGNLIVQPYWKEQVIDEETTSSLCTKHVVILCEPNVMIQEGISDKLTGVSCITLQSKADDIGERFQTYAIEIFEEIQSILKAKPKDTVVIQIIVVSQNEKQLFSGFSGLLKTAQLENPKIIGQLIEVEEGEECDELIEKIRKNSRNFIDDHIRYQGGKRWTRGLRQIEVFKETTDIPWKEQGIYLITGGAGGLGLIFAKEIAQQVKKTTLIMTGRSSLNKEKQREIKELELLGTRIEYREVDVTNKKAVANLIESIQREFGDLHGIIHSAGVIRDNFIIKKNKAEMQEVLAPKVLGLVNLDEAAKDLKLDFFIVFSSTTGCLGNAGQVDYAAGNAFMDAYAGYRNALVMLKQRYGQTLSMNWPLWKNGGMHVDEETEKMIMEKFGMIAMQTETGIQALYQGLASRKDQVMVAEGDIKKLKALFLGQQRDQQVAKISSPVAINKVVSVIAQDFLREKSVKYFKQLLSSAIKLPAHRIEADAPMENYGIDSIMVMQLTNELEKIFGSLPKTLFFEYQNIQELTGYFLESYHEKLVELLAIKEKAVVTTEIRNDDVNVVVKSGIGMGKRPRFASYIIGYREEKKPESLDIAVIGVSGRYPGAINIQEFWRNLRDGKDCVTEIPKDRWDHSLYYDEDKNKPGKTYSKWGGFIEGVDQFDPLFFNISPREAEFMDPQERLFLQCVFETIEDAGYTREALRQYKGCGLEGNIGVYVGVMYEEYQLYGAQETIQGRPLALAGNPSSIANRASYFCNFHGPSMAVDTMCSSSLTAIHLACQSLQRGGCELAIAGGVNVSIHPNKYLMLGQGKFVSSKGRCESFGEGGDGYVPGEGVGAVLLKPLSRAIADGDQIYGVIKGTTINHGGKTNGYTVPNINAQSGVIVQAFKESGINPRTISYVEAHGTGTSLGDPIEVAGLTKSFQEFTKDKQFCAIGSAKSNIGHCESAAGIAGITKILLQLKHRQLAPSLHSKVLNPSIDFSNTPFIVQQELGEWKRPVVDGQEYPRRAGISSFGAGGSNSHIVIEEYLPDNQKKSSIMITGQQSVMIVLSAKNEERLTEQVKRLLFSIQEQQFSDASLVDMAYTLQVGREAMEERLALIVDSINELEEKLKGFIKGKDDIEDLYRGQVKRNKESLAVFATDEDMLTTIDAWINKRKFEKILALWVKGLNCDWNKFYIESKPRRISLPPYPFAKERYWVPGGSSVNAVATSVIKASIHPLLHQNTSDFFEQRFSSTFEGQEFFLMNHVVNGQRVLPGVAYLEMARGAVEQAARVLETGKTGIQLKNVVWVKPIIVGEQPVHVHIGLFLEENGEITYEIYSQSQESGIEPVVHSQGSAVLLGSIKEMEIVDINALQAECNQNVLSGKQCYEAFAKMGIVYGSGHQGIEKIYVGSDKVLAKVVLPSSLSATQEQFVLHPSVMDSALQASIGFVLGTDHLKLALPFALQELEIVRGCTSTMWALLSYSEGNKVGGKIQKLDISLCDEQGRICVQMKGFSSRVLEDKIDKVESVKKIGMLMLEPVWKVQEISLESTAPDYIRNVVMFCEPSEVLKANILTYSSEVDFNILESKKEGIEERFETYAVEVFEEIKKILTNKPKGKVLLQIVVSIQKEQQIFSGLTGLLKTAQLENPKLIGQLIEVELGGDFESIIEKLTESSRSPMEKQIRYQNNQRWVVGLNEIETSQETVKIPWKEQGIYLITGGAGGLGLIFAQEIIQLVEHTTLILTGRSSLNAEKEAKLKELERLGSRIVYRQVDVTDKQAVISLIQNIREEFGNLHGIIHSAGMIRDNFIIRKSKEELQEVVGPKVSGVVHLDEASKELELDFFILFSSITGSMGNSGQADYAVANAFMDAYSGYRNELVALQQRHGQTLSINWPLWKEGGMHVNEETEKMMAQNTGMITMRTATGIQALYQGFTVGKNQVIVLEGNLSQLRLLAHSLGNNIQNDDNYTMNNQMELNNDFYRNIINKIAQDELSKEAFKEIIKL